MVRNLTFLIVIYFFAFSLHAQVPCSSGFQGNGVDDFITIPNTDAINLQDVTDVTIEFWFKTADITTKQVIFEEGGATRAIFFYLEGGRIYLGAYRNDAGTAVDRRFFRSDDGDIEVDKWYHVALTLDSATTLKWFLNGVEQDSRAGFIVDKHSGSISFSTNGDALIYPSSLVSNWSSGTTGGETYSDTFTASIATLFPYTGNIALFRIWNVARTQPVIDTNKSELLTSGTGLVAYLDQDTIFYQPNGETSNSLTASVSVITQYTTIPDTDAINLQDTRDRTIEFRFKANNMTTRQVLYEEGGGANAFTIFIEASRLYFGVYRSGANSAANRRFFRSGIGDVVFNQWYHVAITLDDGTTLKWFLDGVEQDSQTGLEVDAHNGDINIGRTDGAIRYPNDLVTGWTPADPSPDPQTFNNGTVSNGDINNFLGDIALFRIWNTPRMPADILANINTLLTTGTDLVAYQSGTQMNYQPNGGGSITAVADAVGVITWDGSASNVWATTANWIGDIAPNATRRQKVTIPNDGVNPLLTTEISVGFLTVSSGVEIVIQSGATLHVYYSFDNNGTITVENGGSLIYHNCDSPISGSGTFNIKRATPNYNISKKFSYWSSPVVEAAADPAVVFPSSPNIYFFNASIADADWALNSGVDFKPGVGYAVRSESTGVSTKTFTGNLNESSVSVPVYFNTNLASTDPGNIWNPAGDNLLGNPYAAALDWDVIILDDANEEFEGAIYFWDQVSVLVGDNDVDDYKQYTRLGGGSNTTTGIIGAGQGFFIRTTATSPAAFVFKPTYQISGSNTKFLKSATVDSKKEGRSWFLLKKEGESLYSSMLVGFINGATNEFDRLYDGPYNINNKKLGVYSIVEENASVGLKKVTIQGFPVLTSEEKIVSLGFVVDQIGNYTIEISEEHIDDTYTIYLEDTYQNKKVKLKEAMYQFTVETVGEFTDRFKLHYTKTPVVLDVDESEMQQLIVKVYVNGAKELTVDLKNTREQIKQIQLFDIHGREVKNFLFNDKMDVSSLSTGIYIVSVVLDSNKKINKKIAITK